MKPWNTKKVEPAGPQVVHNKNAFTLSKIKPITTIILNAGPKPYISPLIGPIPFASIPFIPSAGPLQYIPEQSSATWADLQVSSAGPIQPTKPLITGNSMFFSKHKARPVSPVTQQPFSRVTPSNVQREPTNFTRKSNLKSKGVVNVTQQNPVDKTAGHVNLSVLTAAQIFKLNQKNKNNENLTVQRNLNAGFATGRTKDPLTGNFVTYPIWKVSPK